MRVTQVPKFRRLKELARSSRIIEFELESENKSEKYLARRRIVDEHRRNSISRSRTRLEIEQKEAKERKEIHELELIKARLEEDILIKAKEEYAKQKRMELRKERLDFYSSQRNVFYENLDRVLETKEKIQEMKESSLKIRKDQREEDWEVQKVKVVQRKRQDQLERITRGEIQLEDVSKRRKSIEQSKMQQTEYLSKVFEEQVARVLQNKSVIDNQRKEYFTERVQEHDVTILQKRRDAELRRVGHQRLIFLENQAS